MSLHRSYFLCLLLLVGCGYQLDVATSGALPISVNYLEKDKTGQVTSSIIQKLSNTNYFHYYSTSAPYVVVGEIIKDRTEYIGYRYQTDDISRKVLKRLSPTEGERIIEIEVKVIHEPTGKVVFGPSRFQESYSFDFVDSRSYNDLAFTNQSGQVVTSLNFSDGQLNDRQDAKSGVLPYLSDHLAEKVVDALRIYMPRYGYE